MSKRLTERLTVARTMTAESSVDAENYVLRNVVLCGFESANRRRYPRKVLEAEVGKYDGAKVYLNHSKDGREFHEWVGVVQKARPGSDGRPRGDVKLFKSEPASATVIEKAQECPEKFGMSHVVVAKTRHERGVEVVESFESVESVDIVTDPATNPGGLFEGKTVEKIPFRQLIEAVLPKLPVERQKAAHRMLSEDDAGMSAVMDTPVDAPADDASGEDAMDDAFKQLMHTSLDKLLDESHSLGEFLKNIRAIYKTRAQVTGNGKGADDAPADDADKTEAKLAKPEDVIAECKALAFSPTYEQGEHLRRIAEKDTRAVVIESFKRAAESKGEQPRSTGRERVKATESADKGDAAVTTESLKNRWKAN